MGIFDPPLSSKLQSNFRYTTGREEHVDFFEMEGIKKRYRIDHIALAIPPAIPVPAAAGISASAAQPAAV